MAKIIENPSGRRMIRLSIDDVFSIIAYYQQACTVSMPNVENVRECLKYNEIYLPEDL